MSSNWDVFRLIPHNTESIQKGKWLNLSLQVLKISAIFLLFFLTLISAVTAKSTFLLILAGISTASRNISICNDKIYEAEKNTIHIPTRLAAKWAWAAALVLCMPEVFSFVASLRQTMFRNIRRPTIRQFLIIITVESLHAYGIGALTFDILPYLPSYVGAMLSNAVCLLPAILALLNRKASHCLPFMSIIDLLAIAAQSASFWAWPNIALEMSDKFWSISLYLIFVSSVWWANFVSSASFFRPMRVAATFVLQTSLSRPKIYAIVSPCKCLIYVYCLFNFTSKRIPLEELIQYNMFGERLITITARNLTQRKITAFQERMRKLEHADSGLAPLSNHQNFMTKNFYKAKTKKFASKLRNLSFGENVAKPSKKRKNIFNGKEKKNKEYYKKKKLVKERRRVRKNVPESSFSKYDDVMNPLTLEKFTRLQNEEPVEGEEPIHAYNIYEDYVELHQFTSPYDSLWIVLVQVCAVIVCYQSTKFACKVMLQRFGFALPISLASPVTVFFLAYVCEERQRNVCKLTSFLPKEIFWNFGYLVNNFQKNLIHSPWNWVFWVDAQTLLWLAWWTSQLWITLHLWSPGQERLARSEKLFVLSTYNGAFIDQSLALNRRRDDEIKVKCNQSKKDGGNGSSKHGSINFSNNLPADAEICKIYVCATMWHENAEEMSYMLKSIFRMDEDQCARRNAQKYLKVLDPDYYEFEAHIVLDDAFEVNQDGFIVTNKYVKQLVENVNKAASSVHQTQVYLKKPKKYVLPYGGRLSYIMPGKNRLTIHLKDKLKTRQRKRWSQVMYLYYLLGYRLKHKISDPVRCAAMGRNTFVLTLDGDVDFAPECVTLLVDLMKKDKRLGAACGRIHPRGSGLLIWYQKFEYAVGHWLQKATEHMIGCVLCSPGCFSLFRAHALMDDNVTRRYATKSEKPIHYIQYDQGEDRWLCTLLLQRGYRVEYCAASDALTFAPEGFSEFFNQRRRWTPSTMANIIDLLRDYKNVVAVNESISIWYILYQCVMLISSVLGPGTIFLMIVGAISISFNIDTKVALLAVTLPVLCFCVCCLTSSVKKQLLLAQVIGAFFAMLMTAVIVGTSLQIQKDSIMSPHSIFLFTVLASFTIAAILHPCEFTSIFYILLYFLAIPCMYMLLPIYSITNLNTVKWGTRENIDEQSSSAEAHKELHKLVSIKKKKEEGEISIGCGSACRLLCCVKPTISNTLELSTVLEIKKINENLDEIAKKLRIVENNTPISNQPKCATNVNMSIDEHNFRTNPPKHSALQSSSNVFVNPENSWINEEYFSSFERQYVDKDEEEFWMQMIEKYLKPVLLDAVEQQRIHKGLTSLRNKASSAFFMINLVFIVIVLILQMQKDCLHIEWPLGPKFNHTLVPCNSEDAKEIWVLTRLQLEPIGLLFLMFFMSILLIQFSAMLMHRIGTMAHIIASTSLACSSKRGRFLLGNYSLSRITASSVDDEKLEAQNAVEIARELQAIRDTNETAFASSFHDKELTSNSQISYEKNYELRMRNEGSKSTHAKTLDDAFRKRFFAISRGGQTAHRHGFIEK